MTSPPTPPRPSGLRRWRGRARVLEAVALMTLAGAAQKWVPMTRWSRVLGKPGAVPQEWRGRAIDVLPMRAASATEATVAAAIRRGRQRMPWEPTCLAQATAGQIMLRQRRQPGVVVIGLRPDATNHTGTWSAHAWLLGRRGALTGGPAAAGFTATTVFQCPDGLDAEETELATPDRCEETRVES